MPGVPPSYPCVVLTGGSPCVYPMPTPPIPSLPYPLPVPSSGHARLPTPYPTHLPWFTLLLWVDE